MCRSRRDYWYTCYCLREASDIVSVSRCLNRSAGSHHPVKTMSAVQTSVASLISELDLAITVLAGQATSSSGQSSGALIELRHEWAADGKTEISAG